MPRDRTKLTDDEVQRFLANASGWDLREGMLRKTYVFEGFEEAIAFVNRVADAAEKADHHPDIDIRWNKVTLVLVSHDASGLTARDTALGAAADRLALLTPR